MDERQKDIISIILLTSSMVIVVLYLFGLLILEWKDTLFIAGMTLCVLGLGIKIE